MLMDKNIMYDEADLSTRLSLEGFSWKFIFEYVSKICTENSSLIETLQNNGHFTRRPIKIYNK
jgi:hypothetical protein